jgi:hypothetical protein
MTDDDPKISQSGLEAIEILLLAAKAHGIGVTIEPDPVGWKIGYILETGGGHLASAYDLETAVRAAERPLDELADLLAIDRDQIKSGEEGEENVLLEEDEEQGDLGEEHETVTLGEHADTRVKEDG